MADSQIIPCLRLGAVSQPTHTAPNVPPALPANAACRTREPFLQSQLDFLEIRPLTPTSSCWAARPALRRAVSSSSQSPHLDQGHYSPDGR